MHNLALCNNVPELFETLARRVAPTHANDSNAARVIRLVSLLPRARGLVDDSDRPAALLQVARHGGQVGGRPHDMQRDWPGGIEQTMQRLQTLAQEERPRANIAHHLAQHVTPAAALILGCVSKGQEYVLRKHRGIQQRRLSQDVLDFLFVQTIQGVGQGRDAKPLPGQRPHRRATAEE